MVFLYETPSYSKAVSIFHSANASGNSVQAKHTTGCALKCRPNDNSSDSSESFRGPLHLAKL